MSVSNTHLFKTVNSKDVPLHGTMAFFFHYASNLFFKGFHCSFIRPKEEITGRLEA